MNSVLQHIRRSVVLGALCAFFTGCAGGGEQIVRSDVQQRADTLFSRALRADQKGERALSEQLFRESLAVSASIEDFNGIVTARINLARIYRLQGKDAGAAEEIAAALKLIDPESDMFGEAAQEKALIELKRNDLDAARLWAGKAVAAEKGELSGRRLNLLGRVLLARQERGAAAETVRTALDKNRKSGHLEEEGNSLRMLGTLARLEKRLSEAERLLLDAFDIDKRAGISAKMAADLEELALVAADAGRTPQAVAYYQRAAQVNQHAGRPAQAAANYRAQAGMLDKLGDVRSAEQARKAAEELLAKPEGQPTQNQ